VSMEIWFWQVMVSPHMTGLGEGLASLGHRVVFVASQKSLPERALQGWDVPDPAGVEVIIQTDEAELGELAGRSHPTSAHICQGIQAGYPSERIRERLRVTGRRTWAIMETVDINCAIGPLRTAKYALLSARFGGRFEHLLAIGKTTKSWMIGRGWPADRISEFSYFLNTLAFADAPVATADDRVELVFVGQLVARKRVDLLIRALNEGGIERFMLRIVGDGPCASALHRAMNPRVARATTWHGALNRHKALGVLANADCLVLPSRHDGWGAVVSEALQLGTRAICSDACGAFAAAAAAPHGRVFRSGHQNELAAKLAEIVCLGKIKRDERRSYSQWARCIGHEAGAQYLERLLLSPAQLRAEIPVPWAHKG
jgi:glycosyltransferase involved in cell wall biosynthesis